MKSGVKLVLDIVIGAIIPVFILGNFSSDNPQNNVIVYVTTALIPVAWVFLDIFFITKRFNFITSYVGLNAVKDGLLAFWFVDGFLYALKDSSAMILSFLIFTGSLILRKPLLKFFLVQVLDPNTKQKQKGLQELISKKNVFNSIMFATFLISLENVLTGGLNFLLNFNNVTAEFGSESFNEQVAGVNAITRIIFPISSFVFFGLGFFAIFRSIYSNLPQPQGKEQTEVDFWELLEMKSK